MNLSFLKSKRINTKRGLPGSELFWRKSSTTGFTLIEIIIVIAIVVIIAVMGVGQYVKQQRNATVATIAEDLALNLRRAQSMAMAVNATSGAYQNGYGIYLQHLGNPGIPQGADSKSYILFTDFKNSAWDHAYSYDSSSNADICGTFTPVALTKECIEKISITSDDTISGIDICISGTCTPFSNTNDILSISFLRPNLDAYFCIVSATATPTAGCPVQPPPTQIEKVQIHLSSLLGRVKTVVVYSTGAISIE